MNQGEAAAKAIIEAVIPGSRMDFVQDQSRSVPDFELNLPSGAVAAVEVTSAVDSQILATHAALKKRGHFVARSQTKNDWLVLPAKGADIRRVRDQIDAYLAAVEADGLSRFHHDLDSHEHESVKRLYEDLNVESGGLVRWKEAAIGIGGSGWAGSVGVGHAQAAVEREAGKEDNRRKLRESRHDEKHLFVLVDSTESAAWVAVRDLDPPASPPSLPPEITVVWAAAPVAVSAWKVWRGSSRGWEKIGLVQP